MTPPKLGNYKFTPLILAILGLAYLLQLMRPALAKVIQEKFGFDTHDFMFITDITVITLLFWLYESWLWKIPVFNVLVEVPNISGRYEGRIEPTSEQGIPKRCTLEIEQSASSLSVCCWFEKDDGTEPTASTSEEATVYRKKNGNFEVSFQYVNSGGGVKGSLDMHRGFNVLEVVQDESSRVLTGEYVNVRIPPSCGGMGVKLVSGKLKRKF
ncbi:MAG: hypothetical protein RRB13_14260 [bacterium]|nr:hypothetical protein [bacterium]